MVLNQGRGQRRSFRRLAVMLLIFSALVSSTALILFPANRALLRTMKEMQEDFFSKAAEYTGYRLEYASLGPSIFSTLDLRNFVMLREDGSVFLSVSRLQLSYSLPALLQGRSSEAFRSARIDRPRLNLDMEKDASLVKLFTSAETGNLPLAELLPDNFNIRLRSGESALLLESFDSEIKNLNLDASVRRGSINFQGKWNASGTFGNNFTASMTGRINGEYSGESGWASVSVPSLAGDSFRLRPLSFSLVLKENMLEVHKIYDRSPSSLSLYWDLDKKNIRASFSGENFSPQDIVTLSGPLSGHNSWLQARLSGRAVLEKQGGEGPLFSLNLRGFFSDEAPLGRGNFILLANGDSEKITFRECFLNTESGYISYTGELGLTPLSPNGLLSVSDFGLYGRKNERLSAELVLSANSTEINVFGEKLTAGALTLRDTAATIFRDDHGLSFDFSAVKIQELPERRGQETVGSIFLEGSLENNPKNIWAGVSIDSFTLRDMAEIARPFINSEIFSGPLLESLGGLSVTTEVFFNTDYEHLLYNAPRFDLYLGGSKDALATASLSGTGERFELNEGRIFFAGRTMSISALADFSNADDIGFEAHALYDDLTYHVEGSFLDRRSFSINGSYGLGAYLSLSGLTSWSGYAGTDHFPIPREGQPAVLSFLVSLRYDSPDFWSSVLDYFELEAVTTDGTPAVLRFHGDADQNGLEIADIIYADGKGTLSGGANLSWDAGYKNYSFAAVMQDNLKDERYDLSAAYTTGWSEAPDAPSKFSLDFSGEKMQIDRIAGSYNTLASGNLRLDWESLNNFTVESELSSLTLRHNGRDISAGAKALLDADEFLIYDAALRYDGLDAFLPYFRVDRPAGLASTKAEIHGALEGRGVDLELQGQAEFGSFGNWLGTRYIADLLEGTLVMERAHYDAYEAEEPFSFVFSSRKDEAGRWVNVNGGPRNMVRFLYSPAENTEGGNFYAALSGPSAVRGSLTGYIDSKTIDAHTQDLYVDLGSLWKFVPPQETIAFPGGIVSAQVRILGPLKEPDFFGTARASSLKIQVPEYIAEDIRPVPLTIFMNGNEMTFGPISASVGNGVGIVSAWFRFDGWIPNTFDMDIYVPSESPIPFGVDISGVVASGSTSGNLRLTLEDMVMTVSGDLTAQNAEISLNSDEFDSPEESRWGADSTLTTMTNLTIRTGRRVEFFWPSFDFPILQAHADLGSGIHIDYDAANRHFALNGNVRLRGGEIFYLDRNFYIREGTLFFRENEVEFDPRISARAEIRDQGPEGPVIISMVIDNAQLRTFSPRFESNPPLSQFEIYSILGQNPQDDPARSRNVLISSTVDAFAQFTMIRRLQRGARNFLGLDMFSVRTQALQNMIFQFAGVNDYFEGPSGGREQANWNSVGTYFDKTTLFLGKYIGSDIFGQALLNFRYDENRQNFGGMYLEPEIGLEMRNPLFDIEFNMIPLNTENWFIDGISFTVSWRRTF